MSKTAAILLLALLCVGCAKERDYEVVLHNGTVLHVLANSTVVGRGERMFLVNAYPSPVEVASFPAQSVAYVREVGNE